MLVRKYNFNLGHCSAIVYGVGDKFVVLKGTEVNTWDGSTYPKQPAQVSSAHKDVKNGILTKDVCFTALSTAGSFIYGKPSSIKFAFDEGRDVEVPNVLLKRLLQVTEDKSDSKANKADITSELSDNEIIISISKDLLTSVKNVVLKIS